MKDQGDNYIDYGQLIDDAMHLIVKNALKIVSNKGIIGDHHFFISFNTQHPEVSISDNLKNKYPNEMTIVIQHQFESLKVFEDKFEIVLSFDQIKEKILIPFDSLLAFADPSVKFGLQFRKANELLEDDDNLSDPFVETLDIEISSLKRSEIEDIEISDKNTDNVISIDSFRKK